MPSACSVKKRFCFRDFLEAMNQRTSLLMQDTTRRTSESLKPLPDPMRKWAGSAADYPRHESLAVLFEKAVSLHGERTALICGGARLTYSELNRRANHLAHHLRELGVSHETLVGLCVPRSLEMVTSILAILKAGGAYVPLDPEYPQERLQWMLRDVEAPVVLATRNTLTALGDLQGRKVIFVEELLAREGHAHWEDPAPAGDGSSLAYVMYTSGSTGTPKGVLVEQHSVARLVNNNDFCHFGPDETFLQLAPISFDASTLEIWGALLHGATLVVMSPGVNSLEQIANTIRDHRVTTLWLTAGIFHLFVDERLESLRPLRQLLAGGDVLSARHVRAVLQALPHLRLINGYGPTENTTFTCCHTMKHGDVIPDSVPLGRPIANTSVYILDESLNPVAPGETGELYAAGDGVARGYLNAPELTAQKFLADPFSGADDARMYRTGDLARWKEDGTVEFLGRVDGQVKIHGHRIEPGEIEAVLLKQEGVKQACVVPRTDATGNKRLAAYYVANNGAAPSAPALKDALAQSLPAFMLPAFFVRLDSLPLTSNGKIDRAALPAPDAQGPTQPPAPQASSVEERILAIWKGVLQLDQISLDDNFFDLGGDSLLIVAAHSQLQKALQTQIEVTDLFEFTTVRALARHLGDSKPAVPLLSGAQLQAQKQREAFAKQKIGKTGIAPE